ncbi:oligosaccharide flippase family protein [Fortiea contorta]|uniref:oligosaccharide flippase family protein n=1 Tax=Fortiea contorta TaxID=1892405 RepID=UPI00034CBC11|nr:oligosaccharide flippase family protein [Fortiea contorta]
MGNKLLKNSFYNAIAGAARIGLALLTIPALIRLLGIKEYGLWALASAVVDLIALSGNGISVTTTVFGSQDLTQDNSESGLSKTLTVIAGGTFLIASLAMIALWFSAESIILLFPQLEVDQKAMVIQAFQIGGLVIWSRLMQQVLMGIEQAYQKYGELNLINTLQNVLLSLGLFIVAWMGGRTIELMQWQVVTCVIILLSHLWTVKKLVKGLNLQLIWEAKKAADILQHSFVSWLICLGSVSFGRGDRLIVASVLGSENLGIYAAITDATSAMNNFAALPVQPIVPLLSNPLSDTDTGKVKLKQQIKQTFHLNAIIALISAAWLFTLAPFVIEFLLKNASSNVSIYAFKIAVIIYGLAALNAVGFYVLLSLAINLAMLLQLTSSFLALLLITFGATSFGLLGAVVGNLGFLATWIMLYLAMKQLNFSKWFWLQCLALPLLWFLVSILTCLLTSNYLYINIILLAIETLILIAWFLKTQKQNLLITLAKSKV